MLHISNNRSNIKSSNPHNISQLPSIKKGRKYLKKPNLRAIEGKTSLLFEVEKEEKQQKEVLERMN